MSTVHTERFAVGDVCVILDDPRIVKPMRKYIGCECVIVNFRADHVHNCKVRFGDGEIVGSHTDVMRKKRPPREDLQIVRWTDVPWQPEQVRA